MCRTNILIIYFIDLLNSLMSVNKVHVCIYYCTELYFNIVIYYFRYNALTIKNIYFLFLHTM